MTAPDAAAACADLVDAARYGELDEVKAALAVSGVAVNGTDERGRTGEWGGGFGSSDSL